MVGPVVLLRCLTVRVMYSHGAVINLVARCVPIRFPRICAMLWSQPKINVFTVIWASVRAALPVRCASTLAKVAARFQGTVVQPSHNKLLSCFALVSPTMRTSGKAKVTMFVIVVEVH